MSKEATENFAFMAVYQSLRRAQYPDGIALVAAREVPDHTNPKFKGIDAEIKEAHKRAKHTLDSEIDRLEMKRQELCKELQAVSNQLAVLMEAKGKES